MKPQIRLINENAINVNSGGSEQLSEAQPTLVATVPMKNTYIMYLKVVASDEKVHFALAKKEKVTATQNAPKLASDCVESKKRNSIANTIQCKAVLIMPTLA